ncbi:MAG: hypothetical protein Q8L48_11825 [Archangium sp.]|nr:hypothetical protein [Archangium sp.]
MRFLVVLALTLFTACPGPKVVSRFRVGGNLVGLEGSGLVLQLNGIEELPVLIGGEFTFGTPVEGGQQYVVTVKTHPTNPAQLCSVARGVGNVAKENIVDVEVSCVTQSFAVGGTVSGLSGSGLVLRNNGGDDLTITANGAFRFLTPVKSGASYSIAVATQPSLPTQSCTIQSGFGVVGSGDVLDLVVTCMTNPVNLGGRVTGLLGGGLVLQNNGAGDLPVLAGATSYSFTAPRDAAYTITVKTQPTNPSQTCTLVNAGGTTTNVDVTNIDLSCTTDLLAVGGTVTGLAGSGLVLHNSDGTDLPVAAGATSYQFNLPSGSAYSLTVNTQPTSPSQTCTLVNATGTVGSTAVSNAHVTCVTASFTVGGTISGLLGSGLVLQNNGGSDLTLAAGATSYSFPAASGSAYSVSVRTQPSTPTQVCTIANSAGTVGSGNVVNVSVTCSTSTFTVGGTVTGLAGTGLTLQNNAGSNLTITPGATQYGFTVPSGSPYAVTVLSQPVNPAQVCTVVNASGTVSGNVTNAHLTCVTSSFTVGGTITGLSGSGLVLQNNGGGNTTLPSGSTTFSFPVVSGGAYAVSVLTQPSNPTQSCVVSNAAGTVTTANVTNVNINCTTTSFTVGGTITGLSGTGLVLQNNLGADLTLPSTATTYSFTVPSSSAYAVTVRTQPTSPTQVCTVSNGSGTVTNVNVTNVSINCVSTVFTIGGPVTGLVGSGLVLQNNGAGNLAVSGSSYTFNAASGSAYSVSVLTQPTNPTQVCTVSNATGTVPNGNVTNIGVSCTCSPYCPQVLLLAGTKSLTAGHLAARYAPGGTWALTRLTGTTQSGTGLAILDDGTGVGLVQNNVDNVLKYTRFTSSWAALADVGTAITTRGKPSLGSGAVAEAVFHGVDFKHYNVTFNGTSWSAVGMVGVPRVPQVFGPSAPVMLSRAPGTFTIGYIEDTTNRASVIDFAGTLWQFPTNLSGETTEFWNSPSLAAPTAGPSTLAVWLASAGNQYRFSTLTGSVWSAAANVTNATSLDPAALLALPAGEVLMAFRGTDGKLYSLSFSAGSWGLPIQVGTASILGSPSMAKGQGGAVAELAYVGTDGAAYHVRLAANRTWGTPVQVGTSIDFVSIVSGP